MKIAIIENNRQDQTLLYNQLCEVMSQYNFDTNIDRYESGEEFLVSYEKKSYDLCFIDIYMNGISGIEMARQFRLKDSECFLIFLTSSRDYIEDSFDVEALRYMLKPIDKVRLSKAIQVYIEKWVKRNCFLKVMIDRLEYTMPYSKIELLMTVGRNIELHTEAKVLITNRRQSFKELTRPLLDDYRFVVLGQGIIVNLSYVFKIEGNNAMMKNGKKYPISRRRVSMVTEAFVRYQFEI